jgi:NADH-quinone oxidoreductase subunit M
MLHLFIIVPLLTVVLVLLMQKQQQIRLMAALGMGAQLALSVFLVISYLAASKLNGFNFLMYETSYAWFPAFNIQYHTGVDGIALAMMLLTALISFTGVLASWAVTDKPKEFFLNLILLSTGAFGFFMSRDLFTMFFFLELAIIPKFLLISIWGSGRNEYSANKLVLMLMGGSALVLTGILGIYNTTGHTFDIAQIAETGISRSTQLIFFPIMFTGFGVFTAMFPFHTWVPDGHSSAPTAASMFLSGISMKMGGYGCLRIAVFLMPKAADQLGWIFLILAVTGVLYAAFATLRQTDLKYINAYSSISHCSLVLIGILVMSKTSVTGAVLQMFSHGLMTALFFAIIGMIYQRTHTREVGNMGGLLKPLPFLGTGFILAGLCSLGLPGLSGFVAEATIFFGSFSSGAFINTIVILSVSSIVITAVYILRMSGQLLWGPVKNTEFITLQDGRWNEKMLIVILAGVIILAGSMPFWLNGMIHSGVDPLVDALKISAPGNITQNVSIIH